MAIVPTIRMKKDGSFIRVNESECEQYKAKGYVPVDGGSPVKVTEADRERLEAEIPDVPVDDTVDEAAAAVAAAAEAATTEEETETETPAEAPERPPTPEGMVRVRKGETEKDVAKTDAAAYTSNGWTVVSDS